MDNDLHENTPINMYHTPPNTPSMESIDKLHADIQSLKTKLRMTKSDRDMISKYATQLSSEMSGLQEKYTECITERDYFASQLRDTKNACTSEMYRLEKEVERLSDACDKHSRSYGRLERENEDIKQELRSVNHELDVLLVDYHAGKDQNNDLTRKNQELRRKARNLHLELHDADKMTTRRLNRIVDELDCMEAERDTLLELSSTYERELDRLERLCFVCRVGVKSIQCQQCIELFCGACARSMSQCPFCRSSIIPQDLGLTSDIALYAEQE